MNKYQATTIQAGEDLDSHQYQAIAFDDGKVANNGGEAGGIILNNPKSGEHVTVGHEGEMKFRAGGAIAAGKAITVATSGYLTAAGSGDYIIGKNKNSAITSGSLGNGIFNFASPIYAQSSSFAW